MTEAIAINNLNNVQAKRHKMVYAILANRYRLKILSEAQYYNFEQRLLNSSYSHLYKVYGKECNLL
jgi:hypothetical protein